jgi:hypothetical protein
MATNAMLQTIKAQEMGFIRFGMHKWNVLTSPSVWEHLEKGELTMGMKYCWKGQNTCNKRTFKFYYFAPIYKEINQYVWVRTL